MLGHSIETNLRYYSFAQKDYLDNVRAILDSDCDDFSEGVSVPLRSVPRRRPLDVGDPQGTPQYHPIFQKRKPRTIDFSMFLGLQP